MKKALITVICGIGILASGLVASAARTTPQSPVQEPVPALEAPVQLELPAEAPMILPMDTIKASPKKARKVTQAPRKRNFECGDWEPLATSQVQRVKRCEWR